MTLRDWYGTVLGDNAVTGRWTQPTRGRRWARRTEQAEGPEVRYVMGGRGPGGADCESSQSARSARLRMHA